MSNLIERHVDPQDEALAMRQYLDLVRSGQLRWDEVTTVALWSNAYGWPAHLWIASPQDGRRVAEQMRKDGLASSEVNQIGLTGCGKPAKPWRWLQDTHRFNIFTHNIEFRKVDAYPEFYWLGTIEAVTCKSCLNSDVHRLLSAREFWDQGVVGSSWPNLIARYGPGPILVGLEPPPLQLRRR